MKSSKKSIFNIIVYAIIFISYLYEFIDIKLGFKYLDEIFIVVLLLRWGICTKGIIRKEACVFGFVAFFYLFYSCILHNNVMNAILMDFVIQSKPYLTFYSLAFTPIYLSIRQKKQIMKLCIIIAATSFPFGFMYAIGNEQPMYSFWAHPARFATMYEILGVTYLLFSRRTKRDIIISIVILCIGCLSLRSKIFAFSAIYSCVMLFDTRINYHNLFSFKNLFLFMLILSFASYLAWSKIQFYFMTGTDTSSEYTMYARVQLYYSSIDIIRDNPLFGTGLGSYATEASAKYYSPIYSRYNLDLNPEISKGEFLSDTYFPALAQFGLMGIFFFVFFWYQRFNFAKICFTETKNSFVLKLTILIIVFFFIESAVDSTFTNNRGVVMMMLLGVAHGCGLTERMLRKKDK